jgi:hypothetical protein
MISIEIENSGSAFDDSPESELARILRKLADQIENGTAPEVLHDLNGNKCGTVSMNTEGA